MVKRKEHSENEVNKTSLASRLFKKRPFGMRKKVLTPEEIERKKEDKRLKLKFILKAINLFSVFKKIHGRVKIRKNLKTSNTTR
jgi:hypothetical protein